MKILILEDDPHRITKFKQIFIGCTIDTTKDPNHANTLIQENEYDLICLDHDLNELDYIMDTGYATTTGYGTALFLSENPHLCKNSQVVVHSLNPEGARRMVSVLKDRNAKHVPFTTFISAVRIN